MNAAIYARYSSENQRPESIEDQLSACRRLAQSRGLRVQEEHVYFDRAASGARRDRQGLNSLLTASELGHFNVVLVDDLSRLARDNYLMLSVLAELRFNGVEVISVADGLETNDEECMLGIQVRGIFNELQLRDLRKKTLRGQIGQKERGFTVGERTFGYRSVAVGEVRMDKKGRPRPEGYRMELDAREAAIVLRIFQEFADGAALTAVVKKLNAEGVRGRSNRTKGWSPATVTRILRNEKYVGRWIWNKTETRRDPKTGRRRRFPKPEMEWIVRNDESLRIVPQPLWERVEKRLVETARVWPGRKGKRGFETSKASRVKVYPGQLFSGAMSCSECGNTIAQVSGKAGGYYGCLAAAKRGCGNRILVRRTLLERVVLAELRDRLASPENVLYLLRRVQREVTKVYADVPEAIRAKRLELQALQSRIANFVDYIGEGRGSRALAKALETAEKEGNAIEAEIQGLDTQQTAVFEPPPRAWIEDRLGKLQSVLERKTARSALLLRRLLGPIRLEPVRPEVGRPYYRAVSTLDALAIVEADPEDGASEPGSTALRQWRRGESNPRPKALNQKLLHA